MKTLNTHFLALLLSTGALLGARGEDFRTNINPALLYYQAFLAAPDPMSDADTKYLASKKGREQKLPERFGKIVAGSDYQFHLVRRAAHAAVPCDWGMDLSPSGPLVQLPHLGRAKAVGQTAQLRAVWALQHGRQEDARDDLLAAFVLARNAASDGLLIGTFVQHVIEGLDYRTVAQHFGEFTPETLQQLVAGFEAAPARHLLAACIPSERGLNDWVLRKIQESQRAHPGDDAKAMAGLRESGLVEALEFGGNTNIWKRLVAASGGTTEGLLKLFRDVEPLCDRLAELMALPQPQFEPQAKQFFTDLGAGSNPFLQVWANVWGQFGFRWREFRAQAQQEMVRAAVQYKLQGESGLKSVTDPFGTGPFSCRRFVFKGVDRGFELKSAYAGADAPFIMIFVEKPGPAFEVTGPDAGKAIAE